MSNLTIGCTAAFSQQEAVKTKQRLIEKFNFVDLDVNEDATVDIIVMLGGDGFALHCIHKFMHLKPKFYGLNYGTVGFLMNNKDLALKDNFKDIIISETQIFYISPLSVKVTDINNNTSQLLAINDVSLLRESSQTAWLDIFVNQQKQMENMMGDGVLIATPIGSTAYNISVNGPILPINSNLLAITPISPFKPRYWRGAMIDNSSVIKIDVKMSNKRPVSVTSDFNTIKNISSVEVCLSNNKIAILFDNNFPLNERIMREQFMIYN